MADLVIIRGKNPGFAMPFREAIRDNAEQLAQAHGITVQFIRHHKTRKEHMLSEIIKLRGERPGLVAILSALDDPTVAVETVGSLRPRKVPTSAGFTAWLAVRTSCSKMGLSSIWRRKTISVEYSTWARFHW
jgi:hypothetical protein